VGGCIEVCLKFHRTFTELSLNFSWSNEVPSDFLFAHFQQCRGASVPAGKSGCMKKHMFLQRNEIRGLESLDGLWDFVRESKDFPGIGLQNQWYKRNLATFPVRTKT
jgi:hypothetical protein